jgi:hypothetical protein
MAKRPALTFAAVKAAKPVADARPAAPVDTGASLRGDDATPAKSRAGRKPKGDDRQFGMTLRMSADLRLALRAAADQDTAKSKAVVSVHDVILKALKADLKRRGL